MDLREIEALLEKFYRGETSLEEEDRLKKYFQEETVPEKYTVERQTFSALSEAPKNEGQDEEFTEALKGAIEEEWQKETKNRFSTALSWASGVAAALIILFFVFIHKNPRPKFHADTFKDPNEAYMETRKILLTISGSMNGGAQKLDHLSEFDQSLETLENLKMIDRTINNIKGNENEND